MALVYTALGVAAGLVGEGLAAALQNPWVLGAFALLMVVMALSMFGFYTCSCPPRCRPGWPAPPAASRPASWPACSPWAPSRP